MVRQKGKILIVDDDPAIRKLLRGKLSKEGFQCEEADSGERTMDKLRSSPIELVILDIKMPGKSGVELLPEIKADYPRTSVIMATAITEVSIAIQCMKQGADDYISKPFNLSKVDSSVARALDKRERQLKIEKDQQQLEEKVKRQTMAIRKLSLGAIEALVYALEAKDKYTAGHSRRVADFAIAIGRQLGLSTNDIEDLRWASLLHDVGKIAVNQLIQNKPGKLTPEEYEHIMVHASVGADIVKPVVNEQVVEMINHHHDHYDGTGHRQTIAGEDIPFGARILAVADAFDSMTSDRPYRSAMSVEEALDEIKQCNRTQFDSVVVTAFLETSAIKMIPTTA